MVSRVSFLCQIRKIIYHSFNNQTSYYASPATEIPCHSRTSYDVRVDESLHLGRYHRVVAELLDSSRGYSAELIISISHLTTICKYFKNSHPKGWLKNKSFYKTQNRSIKIHRSMFNRFKSSSETSNKVLSIFPPANQPLFWQKMRSGILRRGHCSEYSVISISS